MNSPDRLSYKTAPVQTSMEKLVKSLEQNHLAAQTTPSA